MDNLEQGSMEVMLDVASYANAWEIIGENPLHTFEKAGTD